MIFKCLKSQEEKQQKCKQERERLMSWRRKFALLPKRVSETECVWLGFYEERVVNGRECGCLASWNIRVTVFNFIYNKTVDLGIRYPVIQRRKVLGEEWRPMEEAPKDGTEVLVYCGDNKEQFVAFYNSCGLWQFATGPGPYYIEIACKPICWMPLPKSPEERREGV